MQQPKISIVVPTLNEGRQIERCLNSLAALCSSYPQIELIVVDGGSSDDTLDRLDALDRQSDIDLRVLHSQRGRAEQMNRGAAEARGDLLWFVHADCVVPAEAVEVVAAFDPQQTAIGCFRFQLDAPGAVYRLIEFGVLCRTHLFRSPYGDQALFLPRDLFESIGGFDAVPILEDVFLVRKARKLGRLHCSRVRVTTSARRWQQRGVARTWAMNWSIMVADRLGVRPSTLARWRRRVIGQGAEQSSESTKSQTPGLTTTPGERPTAHDSTDKLILFARYPTPGRVKTRLIGDLSADRVAQIYRDLAGWTVQLAQHAVNGPDRAVEVWIEPASRTEDAESWLSGVRCLPQPDGDLGARLRTAFSQSFAAGSQRVVIIGSDCPGLDETLLQQAFEELRTADAVVGPALDGGFYLLGLNRVPDSVIDQLFDEIPWSCAETLNALRRRLQGAGLTVRDLTALRDLDTPEDLQLLYPDLARITDLPPLYSDR